MRKLLGIALFLFAGVAGAVTVSMTAPTNGNLYLNPATFAVKANASASGVGVQRVEFYANDVLIGTDTTSPYQFDWTAPAAGSYTIYAIAYDNNGASAQSASRTVTVTATNTAPTVSLTAPANGSTYLNPSSVTLSATAAGPELNDILQSVAFYLNGNLAGTVTSAPFNYPATGLAVGTYTLTAVATDSQGAQTTSSARTFTVSDTNAPPTVSLVIPVDNSLWNAPATVTFQASVNSGEANDTVSVEFFANGVSQGVRSSAPWSVTQSLSAATYTITAVATDGQGAQTTSASRTITVSDSNLPPSVTITSPAPGASFPTAPVPSIAINTTAIGPEVNGWITKVEFYANGSLIGTRTFGPWNFTWTNVPVGAYILTAIAYDNFNATTTSTPVAITVGTVRTLNFIEVDHLNTPRAIFDANQQLKWSWDQAEPFGVNAPDENPSGLGAFEFPVRFPGQYSDKETNLNYNYFRDYDPGVGQYVQSDPIGAVLYRDSAFRGLGTVAPMYPRLSRVLYSAQPRYNHIYGYALLIPLATSDVLGLDSLSKENRNRERPDRERPGDPGGSSSASPNTSPGMSPAQMAQCAACRNNEMRNCLVGAGLCAAVICGAATTTIVGGVVCAGAASSAVGAACSYLTDLYCTAVCILQ